MGRSGDSDGLLSDGPVTRPSSDSPAATSLRSALIERWLATEDEGFEDATDEQILARIEDLVGEGWHAAGLESMRCERAEGEVARLTALLASAEQLVTEVQRLGSEYALVREEPS